MVTPRDEVERYIELYVIWDKKTYGKNHKRISPPSAYFSWHKFARKNRVDDQWARIIEPSREKRGTEKLAKELIAAANGDGGAIKKKDDTHRMADANKAFAHFR